MTTPNIVTEWLETLAGWIRGQDVAAAIQGLPEILERAEWRAILPVLLLILLAQTALPMPGRIAAPILRITWRTMTLVSKRVIHVVVDKLMEAMIVAVLVTAVIRYAFNQLTDGRMQVEAGSAADLIGTIYQRQKSWDGVQTALEKRLSQAGPNDIIKRRRLQVFDEQNDLIFDNRGPIVQRLRPKPINGVESPIIVDGRTIGSVFMGGQIGEFTQAETDFLRLVRWSVVIVVAS